MIVPPRRPLQVAMGRWSAAELVRFRMTDGRFLAPVPGAADRAGFLSRPATFVGGLTTAASQDGSPPPLTDADHARAREELRQRGVAIVIMPTGQVNGAAVRTTMDTLVGPGRLVTDMWVWDVRSLA
jgi:hypothetical protein